MGKEEEEARRLTLLNGYQINRKLLEKAKKEAIVLHCLPAYRGKEISEEVFEQFSTVIFDQAENRLHTQKSILDWMSD
jgi:ornithine carbamoyltransferase